MRRHGGSSNYEYRSCLSASKEELLWPGPCGGSEASAAMQVRAAIKAVRQQDALVIRLDISDSTVRQVVGREGWDNAAGGEAAYPHYGLLALMRTYVQAQPPAPSMKT